MISFFQKMNLYKKIALLLLLAGIAAISLYSKPKTEVATKPSLYQAKTTTKKSIQKKDWNQISQEGLLRVLVTPSRTNFFVSKDKGRGFELEMFNLLEEEVNKSRKQQKLPPLQVQFIPVAHSELIPSLQQGHGDIAAAMLTITKERSKEIDFTIPYLSDIHEVLVQHSKAPAINSLKDLSGKTVVIAAGTSYHESLKSINQQLTKLQLKVMRIIPFNNITSESILEMINSGLFSYTFVDNHLAKIWSSVLTNLKIDNSIHSAKARSIGWAVRKNNPQLKNFLNNFLSKHKKGSLMGNILFKRYYTNKTWLKTPLASSNNRLDKYRPMFEAAAKQYDFDWLMLAMQGFQESQLDPNTTSHAGAVGIMQLLPSTAKDMGLSNLKNAHANIMAGTKYMDWIRTHYFNDPKITKENKYYFCLAAYNAGFGRVKQWRKAASEQGVDPNTWFGQVEKIALKQTGYEPVQYVGNIVNAHAAMQEFYLQTQSAANTLQQIKQ